MSAYINDGGPAFPRAALDANRITIDEQGMALRDWFAGQAIDTASDMEHGHPTGSEGQPTYTGIAIKAYYIADAMIAARKETKL